MGNANLKANKLGWAGTGRMGYALVAKLLEAGCDVTVYNRTRSKAEPLAELGATIVDTPAELADRDIVFTIVAGPTDFRDVLLGPTGVFSREGIAPPIIVDSTTVSPKASAEVRLEASARGTALLAAPVSGNPRVVEAGRLTMVTSGPEEAHRTALPYLELMTAGVTYVGDGDGARLVKVCHNLMLGVVAQTMAEIAVLAEKGGVARADLLQFLNGSVMGSMFTRYKTPAYVNLDFTPTFTPALLLKDFDLGLEAANELGVPLPVASTAAQIVQSMIGNGYTDVDCAALLELQARGSALELQSEDADVTDGLSDNGRVQVAP
jgi:3-hydroxyisobutyrate dehydrogenase-like beta-hydroxyacid dehydrogenase